MRTIAGCCRGMVTAVLAAVATAGCGGGGGDGDGGGGGGDAGAAVTVTVTRPASAAGSATPTAAPPPAAPSPVAIAPMDRSFDAGLVTATRRDGETLVLSIDRLTVAGVDDAALAATGVPVEPDPGDRFGNQRVALYDVAVAPDALFVLTSCTRGTEGVDVQSKPLSAEDFVASVPADAPVIVTYTDGLVSRAEVNPRC